VTGPSDAIAGRSSSHSLEDPLPRDPSNSLRSSVSVKPAALHQSAARRVYYSARCRTVAESLQARPVRAIHGDAARAPEDSLGRAAYGGCLLWLGFRPRTGDSRVQSPPASSAARRSSLAVGHVVEISLRSEAIGGGAYQPAARYIL